MRSECQVGFISFNWFEFNNKNEKEEEKISNKWFGYLIIFSRKSYFYGKQSTNEQKRKLIAFRLKKFFNKFHAQSVSFASEKLLQWKLFLIRVVWILFQLSSRAVAGWRFPCYSKEIIDFHLKALWFLSSCSVPLENASYSILWRK